MIKYTVKISDKAQADIVTNVLYSSSNILERIEKCEL